jgi:hypothetical protein
VEGPGRRLRCWRRGGWEWERAQGWVASLKHVAKVKGRDFSFCHIKSQVTQRDTASYYFSTCTSLCLPLIRLAVSLG